MQIESVLRAILVADPGVAAIIGTRAYQGRLPREPTFPAVIYQMISRPQDGLTGIVQSRMQYTCMAETWKAAADLADAVRCALHGYRGVQDGARIEYIQYAGQYDDHDETTGIYWIPVDMIVTYLEET
ncbi:MAG TPA: DUF3168 domain-containing protein [Dermatophilaceae bacterium]|nr:DUF3168 domain-containing protein [Dermatophilaceae bacterium]